MNPALQYVVVGVATDIVTGQKITLATTVDASSKEYAEKHYREWSKQYNKDVEDLYITQVIGPFREAHQLPTCDDYENTKNGFTRDELNEHVADYIEVTPIHALDEIMESNIYERDDCDTIVAILRSNGFDLLRKAIILDHWEDPEFSYQDAVEQAEAVTTLMEQKFNRLMEE